MNTSSGGVAHNVYGETGKFLLSLEYPDLMKFIESDKELKIFLYMDGFWKLYCKKYSVKEIIRNNYFFLLRQKIKYKTIVYGYNDKEKIKRFNDSNVECLKVIMTYTNNIFDQSENFPLKWGCQMEYVKVVKLLLKDNRLYPGDEFDACLRIICSIGNLKIFKVLMADSRVDPRVIWQGFERSPLGIAVSKKHTKIVKLLLQDPRVIQSLKDESVDLINV